MRITLNIVLLFFIPLASLIAQDNPNSFSLNTALTHRDTSVKIGSNFIIQYSEKLTLDTNIILKPGIDYRVDYRNGVVNFDRDLFARNDLDTSLTYPLKIEYDVFPYKFPDEYSNFDRARRPLCPWCRT